jgi:hypothetical protein
LWSGRNINKSICGEDARGITCHLCFLSKLRGVVDALVPAPLHYGPPEVVLRRIDSETWSEGQDDGFSSPTIAI